MDQLESALLIELAGTIPWSAALPPVVHATGTLTSVDPGGAFDVTKYARRDREFQHRDMVAAGAVAKVAVFGRTVWGGTLVMPVLQGVTEITDLSGTNVVMPLDPSQVGSSPPNSSTAVQYVLNTQIPYDTVRVTDINLYNRDLLLYETLARAASIFTPSPPISQIDPGGAYIGSTSIWATAQGTDLSLVPNAAEPMNQATFKNPDLYLAGRDNKVAGYVSRVAQALKNPFEYATRIYVAILSTIDGGDSEESETYVLTNNVFIQGNTYTAGEQVLFNGAWYQAINTTTDTPPSSNWTVLTSPTQLQFLADPSLSSRNRIIYDRVGKTLQWFRETLDLVHVPQIVGFLIPGILPGQQIETVPAIPEPKDAQFYRQKSTRLQFATGTFSNQQVFSPTGNRDPSVTSVDGGLSTLLFGQKDVTLPIPGEFTVTFDGLFCSSGTYAVDCLVRPCPHFEVAGGDNDQGSVDTIDGGTTYGAVGDVRNWEVSLPAGGWKMFIEFSNVSNTLTSFFGIRASQGATAILANTLPIYYTDSVGSPLQPNTVITSPGIDIQSSGQTYNFSVAWTSGAGQLHIRKLRFEQVNGPTTSHYIMAASWLNSRSAVPETVIVAGGDAEGVTPTGDGGVDFPGANSTIDWLITLPLGNWQMVIEYSNSSSDPATQFGIAVTLPGLANQPFNLSYTDSGNNPLPQDTLVLSSGIGVMSDGSQFTLGIKWTTSAGVFHIKALHFTLESSTDSISNLDVIGAANNPDIMPFRFFLAGTDAAPQINITWLPKSASIWQQKPYNPGDQVLFNLVYWQASTATTAADVPGQSSKWFQLGVEPQIPLVFEQIQLSKLVSTQLTPDAIGFQGFRQDMAERALRSDEDAYRKALSQTGTIFPEFREDGDRWTIRSTGSWMSFLEVYEPRLRQSAGTIASGQLVQGRQYQAITITPGDAVIYNGGTFVNGQRFFGVNGISTYLINGSPAVVQVGAYQISKPGDIGKIGLIPAGIEYVISAGTGTIHGWYPSYASYPTHQALQPWMIEQGFYVADNDLQSPDGNPIPPGTPDNSPVVTTPTQILTMIRLPTDEESGVLDFNGQAVLTVGVTAYALVPEFGGTNLFTSSDALHWSLIGTAPGGASLSFGLSLFVVGDAGSAYSSPDGVTWATHATGTGQFITSIVFAGGKFVGVCDSGRSVVSTNGTAWSNNATGFGGRLNHVTFGAGLYVAVGSGGEIITSSDGASWTARTSGTGQDLWGITFGGGQFVVVGNGGTVLTSPDGITWTPQSAGTVQDFRCVTFGNNIYYGATTVNTGYHSPDGITWTNDGTPVSGTTDVVDIAYLSGLTFYGVQQQTI